ncbi:MAG: glycosyltransferase [Candidatus Bathyarchaeia archaeon]
MCKTKILVTLPQSIVGGADVRSINTLQALRMMDYDTSPLIYPFKAKPYFVNYLNHHQLFLKAMFSNYLSDYNKVVAIVTCPQFLYHLLDLKKVSPSKIVVLWLPGGNDFCCPLHTEVCPESILNSSYGCVYSAAFFLKKCVSHMLRSRRLSVYHLLIWPNLRYKAFKYLDGFLASRSIYIKGCKYVSYEKCHYVGFGIDINIFKPRSKEDAIIFLTNLLKYVLWGNLDNLLKDVKENDGIVIGYVGATEPCWKNLETLILAFRKLFSYSTSMSHRTWLLIVGRSTSKLLSLLNAVPEPVRKRIVVMDRISYKKVPFVYNLIDIFVNPSLLDSLEFNTLEALASGDIVLASSRGSIDDLRYYYGIDVLRFAPNPDSLATLLENVLLDIENFKKIFMLRCENIRKFIGLKAYALRLKNVIDKYIK